VHTAEFDYDLPSGLIAQHPVEPRDSCRLMIVDRASGQIDHRVFSDLIEYVRPGDLLVLNDAHASRACR
jgi:S-adenosylmethionine:tRNA ribosyltransferase-isomerase